MKMKAFLAALTGLVVASVANAATITYTLVTGTDGFGSAAPGSFAVYAQTSPGDNSGLAAFQFGLNGSVNAADLFNYAPLANYTRGAPTPLAQRIRTVGFSLFTGTSSASSVRGAQDTASYDTAIANGTTQLVDLVYGFGQTAGNIATRNESPYTYSDSTSQQPQYDARLLVASGTYSLLGTAPTLAYGNGNIFTSTVPFGTTSSGTVATINSATLVNTTFITVPGTPEPASLAVLGVVGIGALSRRRKAVVA